MKPLMLSRPAWRTEKKLRLRGKSEYDVFIGTKRIFEKKDAQGAWNQSREAGYAIVAAHVGVTKDDDETGRCTSGGVTRVVNKQIVCVFAQNGR